MSKTLREIYKGTPTIAEMEWLIKVAEAAKLTRGMLKQCLGRPCDETATIFLDEVFKD